MITIDGRKDFAKVWFLSMTFRTPFPDNGRLHILMSPGWENWMVAMLIAGVLTSIKRTVVALFFGRRTFGEFKPRLEKLLREVVLLSEVSVLAAEIQRTYDEGDDEEEVYWLGRDRNVKFFSEAVSWSTRTPNPASPGRRVVAAIDSDDESEAGRPPEASPTNQVAAGGLNSSRDDTVNSDLVPIRAMLEDWEEPVNKMDKVSLYD